jgi:N6-L-threonylcarbamoyladenine synthase
LWTGILFAQDLAKKWNKKIVPCNHMEGHILTALIKKDGYSYKFINPPFPALSLLISGGHTQIVLVEGIGKYKIVGETHDDAIGECFDKVARTLGLEYPGGPKISKLADEARREGITSPEPLPRPMINSKDLNFSFSGLKTAVLYLIKKLKTLDEKTKKGIAREVEDSVTDVVVSKMRKAIEQYAVQSIIVGGGVIANKNIREHLEKLALDCSIPIFLPQFDHATDNGLMIALAGYFNRNKAVDSLTKLKASGILPIGEK